MKKGILLILALLFVLPLSGFGQTIPAAYTHSASNIGYSSASLQGRVNPAGAETRYRFEYGTSQSLGMVTPEYVLSSQYGDVSVSANINTSAGTTYYFRLIAQNQYGTSNGNVVNFTTPTTGGSYDSTWPSITANAASNIGGTFATFRALADVSDIVSEVWFEYGTDYNNLNQRTPSQTVDTYSYYSGRSISPFVTYYVTGLNPGTAYYFRPVIRNYRGTGYGSVMSFTTDGSRGTFYGQGGTYGVSYGLPSATTRLPSYISETTATFSGSGSSPNSDAFGYFEYGTTQSLGQKTSEKSLGRGDNLNFFESVSNLISGALYYVRTAVRNAAGTTYGPLASFRTHSATTPVIYQDIAPTYPAVPSGNVIYIPEDSPRPSVSRGDYYYEGFTSGWRNDFQVYAANLNREARAAYGQIDQEGNSPSQSANISFSGGILTFINLLGLILIVGLVVFVLRRR